MGISWFSCNPECSYDTGRASGLWFLWRTDVDLAKFRLLEGSGGMPWKLLDQNIVPSCISCIYHWQLVPSQAVPGHGYCQVGCSRSCPIAFWMQFPWYGGDENLQNCSLTFRLMLQQRDYRHGLCFGTARRICRSVVSGQVALLVVLPASSPTATHSCLFPDQHKHSLTSTVSWTGGLIQATTITLQIINFSYSSLQNISPQECRILPPPQVKGGKRGETSRTETWPKVLWNYTWLMDKVPVLVLLLLFSALVGKPIVSHFCFRHKKWAFQFL